MQFLLLGPVEVRDEGRSVPLPRRQQRALLAALLLRAGEVVSTDRLVDELWGEHPPASAMGSLQNAVSQLRKTLGPDLVRTQPPGYVLTVEPDAVDARRFERLLGDSAGRHPTERAALLREALALWRGPALADLTEHPWAETEAARLDELRLTALEERVDAELDLGRHPALVAQLEALVAEHPLRERLGRQLALALYRSGRQVEALDALRHARERLDELGLEPSGDLRQLERDILTQSASIAAPAAEAYEEVPAEVPGERRVVSVLAAAMPEHEDPDALRAALARVLDAASAAVSRHGGELERFGPEGLVAVFGADGSREDDAVRAVRAGVELAEAAGVAVGVATGEAVIADEPRVAGAAVARAAGLARSSDGILLDPRTHMLVRDSATVEQVGPLARVLSVRRTRPESGPEAPLVGREAELGRLRAAFADACEQRRCIAAAVIGEPGIGKTRLARELAGSLDATQLVGRCAAYGEGATFMPLVEALHGVDPALAQDDLVARRVEQLGGAAHEPGSLGESYWAVRRLLEALAGTRPVALILDDVHWAEPALLDLVEYLSDRVTDAPLLVLCLARPELLDERPGWAADAMRLDPLADDETRALVVGTATVEEAERERIVELAEGNPLYAQQLTAYAAESGKALAPGELPATIEAVLAGRLGRLDAGERATLQRAAVVGREFSRGTVAALAPPDLAVDAHLLALARRGFVRAAADALPGDDAYRFHHVLLRDAAYATLTKSQRAQLHERVAGWLDRDGPGDDALVGYHLEQSAASRETSDDQPEVANAAGCRLARAGIRALGRTDIPAAIGLLDRASKLLAESPERAEALYELAISLAIQGRSDESLRALDESLGIATRCGDERIARRAALEIARTNANKGELSPDDLQTAADEAIPVLERLGDHRGVGRAWLTLSSVYNLRCQNVEMGRAAEQAAIHYRDAGFSNAHALLDQAHALYYGPAPVDAAIAQCRRLGDQATDLAGEAHALAIVGGLEGLKASFDDALRHVADAGGMYDDLGMALMVSTYVMPLRMEIARLAGDLDGAASQGYASLESLLDLQPGWAATRAAQLADIELDRGDLEAAERLVRIAKNSALRHDVLMLFLVPAVEARLLSLQGLHERAEQLAREAVRVGGTTDAVGDRVRTLLALAEVMRRAGRPGDAQDATADAARLMTEKGNVAGLMRLRERGSVPAA